MRTIILIYGTIAGVILIIMFGINIALMKQGDNMGTSEIIGYASMILALSSVYIGTRKYRDHHLQGIISFGQAFKVGILITLLASLFYIVGWKIMSGLFYPDFHENYGQYMLDQLSRKGASPEEIADAKQNMENFKELMKNPFAEAAMSFMEIFPVGLLVTLVSAWLLKAKK